MFGPYRRLIGLGLLTTAAFVAGQGCPGLRGPRPICAGEDPAAAVNVAGVYRYSSTRPFSLAGTITFERDGLLVRVTDTTYDNSRDRALMGEATLEGNRLTIQLVPRNGDADYRADVTFIFSADGSAFCVQFFDTNGDAGELGSYRGTRISS